MDIVKIRALLKATITNLQQMLELLGEDTESAQATSIHSTLPLESLWFELPIASSFKARVANAIKGYRVMTLGELLAMDEREWLRIPNFGRLSFIEVSEVLAQHFGVTVGCIPEPDCTRFMKTLTARRTLEHNAGILLTLEGKDSGFNPVVINPALFTTLRQAGILYKTQLATAPKEVIDQICQDHSDWYEQLSHMLGHGFEDLRLYTEVPSHLNSSVSVYKTTSAP